MTLSLQLPTRGIWLTSELTKWSEQNAAITGRLWLSLSIYIYVWYIEHWFSFMQGKANNTLFCILYISYSKGSKQKEYWFGLVLWSINHCRLFNAKSCLYIYIKYIWFVNILLIILFIYLLMLNYSNTLPLFIKLKKLIQIFLVYKSSKPNQERRDIFCGNTLPLFIKLKKLIQMSKFCV